LAEYYASADGGVLWTDEKGITAKGERLVAAFAAADDWGLSAKSFAISDLAKSAPAEMEIKLSMMLLKYARHARGGRIPEPAKQLSSYLDRVPQYLEPKVVLSGAAKADDVQAYLQSLHPKQPQFEKLRQRFLEARAGGAARAAEAAQLRANMEMWRWIPDDMGKLYVWVNLPEYMIRVIKDGIVIHEERAIVGLKDKQTPVFSDEMETIVFKPYWALPESIKVDDVYPSLARGGTVAKRYNLRVAYNGRIIDPSTVDWSTADIRKYEIYQPSGEGNMMGVLKFLFPNKHQTYMHDTPDKKLFEAGDRTFSHGCMRVRNPVRLAEVVLAEDQGLQAEKIQDLATRGPENNSVQLGTKIPVHITYFTVWIGDDGTPVTFKDMYGHEQRVRLALEGKFAQIARGPDHLAPVKMKQLEVFQEKRSSGEMMHGFMNNF
jgi:murein L,D-transpeptidase YcbB/YkuD